eukprot:6375145-Pyramimonas_sp.AAC.1
MVAVSQKPTTLASVDAVVRPWLATVGFNAGDFSLIQKGETPARRFEIHFSGPTAAAARKV